MGHVVREEITGFLPCLTLPHGHQHNIRARLGAQHMHTYMCADKRLDQGQEITAITEKYPVCLGYIIKVVQYKKYKQSSVWETP